MGHARARRGREPRLHPRDSTRPGSPSDEGFPIVRNTVSTNSLRPTPREGLSPWPLGGFARDGTQGEWLQAPQEK